MLIVQRPPIYPPSAATRYPYSQPHDAHAHFFLVSTRMPLTLVLPRPTLLVSCLSLKPTRITFASTGRCADFNLKSNTSHGQAAVTLAPFVTTSSRRAQQENKRDKHEAMYTAHKLRIMKKIHNFRTLKILEYASKSKDTMQIKQQIHIFCMYLRLLAILSETSNICTSFTYQTSISSVQL